MAIREGISFSDLAASPPSEDEKMLEYSMNFVFAVEDRLDELGMSRAELAEKLHCKKSRVTRVLSGEENITLKTIAKYDAALGIGFELVPSKRNAGESVSFHVNRPKERTWNMFPSFSMEA